MKKIAFQHPVSDFSAVKKENNRKNDSLFVLQQIVITRFGIFGQFLHPFQEFRLKNDTRFAEK